MRLRRAGSALGAGAVVSVAAAEWLHWRASRRHVGAGPCPDRGRGSEAVIVLGYPARRGGKIHPVQRWRCQIAVRSMDPAQASRLIFTGAAGPAGSSEAAVMAGYARDVLGIPPGQISLETRARTTRQNMEFTVPMAETADVIKIASDPLHAARARRYLGILRPDLAGRVCAADDYRFGEHWWLKVPTAAYEIARWIWRLAGLPVPRKPRRASRAAVRKQSRSEMTAVQR